MNIVKAFVLILLMFYYSSSLSVPALESEEIKPRKMVDLNVYWDTRKFEVGTANILFDLPYGFEYFSFSNLFGLPKTADDFRLNKYYTEQDVRYKLKNCPVDPAFQWASGSSYRDTIRLGARARLHDIKLLSKPFKKVNLNYELTYFPLQFDGSKGYDFQLEHFYRIQVLPSIFKDRVYILGFLDHNLLFGSDNKNKHNLFVTENQLGIKIHGPIYFVLEQRYNQFYKSKKHGLGIGLQYLLNF